jgi:hypothetical protein
LTGSSQRRSPKPPPDGHHEVHGGPRARTDLGRAVQYKLPEANSYLGLVLRARGSAERAGFRGNLISIPTISPTCSSAACARTTTTKPAYFLSRACASAPVITALVTSCQRHWPRADSGGAS